MIYSFFFLFLIFLIYSFIGYVIEVINVSYIDKKLTFNRGFFIGPWIPIYGVGSVLMTLSLTRYEKDIIVLFIMSMVICTLLEYITSFILEKIFKLRWWDYTNMKYNINGRVCLENGVLFGIGGTLIIKIANPIIIKMLYSLPSILLIIIGLILFTVFLVDLITSFVIMFKIKINVSKYINKDATSAIRKEVAKALKKSTFLTTRIFKAFPNINLLNKRNEKRFTAFKTSLFQTINEMDKLKKDYKKKREKLKNKLKKK